MVMWAVGWLDFWVVITLMWWPFGVSLWNQVTTRTGRALNPTLGNTGRGLLIYSVALATALILSA
jgi:hypothetical protein